MWYTDILNKLFNPLKQNKQRKYKDLSKDSKKVESNVPSELLICSRDIAGIHIQKHMSLLNNCKWIRADYTYPAFDSMNFIYKNKVFSIIIDIQDEEGNSYLPDIYIKRQLLASKDYNLIPCKFPVVVDNPHEPDINTVKPLTKGWNLFDTNTGEVIEPEHLATTEKIPISDWEMRNFAIQVIRKQLEARGFNPLSYQDTLEVDPQMWFETKEGKKCWIVIRCDKYPAKSVEKPKELNEIIRRCFKNDGFFASMILTPIDSDILYRGCQLNIDFKGIEKIHSVI